MECFKSVGNPDVQGGGTKGRTGQYFILQIYLSSICQTYLANIFSNICQIYLQMEGHVSNCQMCLSWISFISSNERFYIKADVVEVIDLLN